MKKIIWILYGILIGPIEFLLINLLAENMSLFLTIGMMALFSIIYLILPLLIRLIIKKKNKDFYGQNEMYLTNFWGVISISITWAVVLYLEVQGEGLFTIILAIILAIALIIIHHKLLWGIYKLIYEY